MGQCVLTGEQFASYVVTQLPYYDEQILRDIRPTDGEVGHFATGTWDSYTSATHTKDRFNVVFPDLTASWRVATDGSCIGTPCDFPVSKIGWGNTRLTYGREQIEYKTDLLCFDNITDQTKAVENYQQIISDVLRKGTNYIISDFYKRKAAELADKKWVTSTTASPNSAVDFTFAWENNGTNTQYMTTTQTPTSVLTPFHLRTRFNRLVAMGYFGPLQDPSGASMPMWVELVTDNDTLFNMVEGDAAVIRSDGTKANQQWRFQEFKNVMEFYKYNWSGTIGNFVTRTDLFPLRFNRVSTNRFQRVLPYRNIAATNGLKDEWNPDYDNAHYQFSRIHHRSGLRILTKNLSSVNTSMGFMPRSLAGEWKFAVDNLGADCNGVAISNYKKNKGFFYADFDMAAEPLHTEWMETIFHLRTPQCIVDVTTCSADPGYPTQNYSATNALCPTTGVVVYITPVASASGDYNILANTITVNGVPIVHSVISGSSTIAALVTELNTDVAILGTWAAVSGGTQISLTGSSGATLVMPWVLT